jgi:hypothetical protein
MNPQVNWQKMDFFSHSQHPNQNAVCSDSAITFPHSLVGWGKVLYTILQNHNVRISSSQSSIVGFHPNAKVSDCREWWQDVRQQLLCAEWANYTV